MENSMIWAISWFVAGLIPYVDRLHTKYIIYDSLSALDLFKYSYNILFGWAGALIVAIAELILLIEEIPMRKIFNGVSEVFKGIGKRLDAITVFKRESNDSCYLEIKNSDAYWNSNDNVDDTIEMNDVVIVLPVLPSGEAYRDITIPFPSLCKDYRPQPVLKKKRTYKRKV